MHHRATLLPQQLSHTKISTTIASPGNTPTATTFHEIMKLALIAAIGTMATTATATTCLGEYVQCPNNGACVLDATQDCDQCDSGYLCPTFTGQAPRCIPDLSSYTSCPGLKGSHLDATLTETERLDYITQHTTLDEQIQQLQNGAPSIHDQGIPAYQWLNDDQHGVARTPANATVFPNGVGLGATFDKDLIKQVGYVIGNEARGLHNGFLNLDPTGREMKCNGCGITGKGSTFFIICSLVLYFLTGPFIIPQPTPPI